MRPPRARITSVREHARGHGARRRRRRQEPRSGINQNTKNAHSPPSLPFPSPLPHPFPHSSDYLFKVRRSTARVAEVE